MMQQIAKLIHKYTDDNFEQFYRELREEDRNGELDEIVELIDERLEYAKTAIEEYVNTYFTSTLEKLEAVLNEHTS